MIMQIFAWWQANAVLISEVLGAIVLIDHTLAALPGIKSSSTAQAILNGIAKAISWVMMILPKSDPVPPTDSTPPAPPAA